MVRKLLIVLASVAALPVSANPVDDRSAARALFDRSEWREAAAAFSKIVAANPDRGSDHLFLARALMNEKRCGEAKSEFHEAIRLGVDGTRYGLRRAHVDAARCAAALGDADRAFEHLSLAHVRYGFDDFAGLRTIGEFGAILKDPRFATLAGLPTPGLDRVAGWRADLADYSALLEERHPEPFHQVSREAWKAAVAALDHDIPALTDVQIVGGFMRLAAMIGDGHTSVYPPLEGPGAFRLLPIWPYRLGADWYVLGADPSHRELVGTRIVAINGMPMSKVEQNLRVMLPSDNDRTIAFVGNTALQFFELAGLAARADLSKPLSMTFFDKAYGSRTAALQGAAIDRDPTTPWVPGSWARVGPTLPLWLQHSGDAFFLQSWDEGATVYAQINRIADGSDETFEQFVSRLGEAIRKPSVKRLIIDLRHNNGGSGSLNWTLVRELVRTPALDRRGSLFVITGSRTFSAAMNLASMIETHTEAIFVGEPTGSRPNFYGEDTPFTLANSGLSGSISSAWFQGGTTSDDERPFIAPDLPAPLTLGALESGTDPALEAIQAYLSEQPRK